MNNEYVYLLEDYWGNVFDGISTDTTNDIKTNLIDEGTTLLIKLLAPGRAKKDFKIEETSGVLTVSAQGVKETKEYNKKEFSIDSFTRTFSVPINSSINAEYVNGILIINVTKPKQKDAKYIEVK